MHFLFTGSISRAIEAMTTHTLPSMLGMLRVHRRKKSQLTACRCHLHSHILGSKDSQTPPSCKQPGIRALKVSRQQFLWQGLRAKVDTTAASRM